MFIHYGHSHFDRSMFEPIRNDEISLLNKPHGGLWASPTNGRNTWKQWCEAEQYRECSDDCCFHFKLLASARIARIETIKDYEKLPKRPFDNILFFEPRFLTLDFEEIRKHYDAILYIRNKELDCPGPMTTWDCDSLLVLNPDVVVEAE